MPTVSVILPTYNRSGLLKEAIASVLAQTFGDFEIIVVDDGSYDDTCQVVEAILDPRLKYLSKENRGLAAARNTGIRRADGKYIAFLDDDDLWLPEKLELQVQLLDQNPQVGLVTGGWKIIDDQGKTLKQIKPWIWRPNLDLDTWLMGCPTVPSGVILRREWLGDEGGFDESLPQSEDWDRWLRLSYAGCPMAWVEDLVCAYRVHSTSMVQNARKQKQNMIRVLDKFFADPALSSAIRFRQPRIYAAAYLRGAAREYGAGQVEDAKADVEKAIGLDSSLMDNNGHKVYTALLAWTSEPTSGDPVSYITTVFDHLPDSAGRLKIYRHKAIAFAARDRFFDAYFQKDWRLVFNSLALVALHHPLYLIDRGMFAVTIKSMCGFLQGALLKNGKFSHTRVS